VSVIIIAITVAKAAESWLWHLQNATPVRRRKA
jgi:hypothetical protein